MLSASHLKNIIPIIVIFGIVLSVFVVFWRLLDMILLAFSLAIVVMPLQRRIIRKVKSRWIAALLTTTLVLSLFAGTIYFTFFVISQNGAYLAEILVSIAEGMRTIGAEPIVAAIPLPPEQVEIWANSQLESASVSLSDFLSQIPLIIVKFIIFFLSLYLFFLGGDRIREELSCRLPQRLSRAVDQMTEPVVNTLYAIFVVHFSIAALTFILALPFFYVLGYGHVVFYALIAAIFQLFPMIGDSMLMLFLLVFAISQGDIRGVVLVIFLGYPVVSALPDLYYRPLLMGSRAAIHPILMWIGFFGGAIAMGTIGIILGPVLITLLISGYRILVEGLKETYSV
jgi:predicted PurR-regulated permease PerM